jgi:hypothetical protein
MQGKAPEQRNILRCILKKKSLHPASKKSKTPQLICIDITIMEAQ